MSLLRLVSKTVEPFQNFICYWTAFNNIYSIIADKAGLRPTFSIGRDGRPSSMVVGGLQMRSVKPRPEPEQINLAFDEFGEELKDSLIKHGGTHFFVYRTPSWRGRQITHDSLGQKLNGVLNVTRTVDSEYPTWSPITTELYEAYLDGNGSPDTRDRLAKEIVYMLYTVRNNLVHGSKAVDDANSREVIQNALPLLEMIVDSFVGLGSSSC